MASVLGFTLLPIWLSRRRLPANYRIFLWSMLPCLAVTVAFGIWIESRIAIEWSVPCALFAATEFVHFTRENAVRDAPPERPGSAVQAV